MSSIAILWGDTVIALYSNGEQFKNAFKGNGCHLFQERMFSCSRGLVKVVNHML